MLIFIDESGDTGRKIQAGASEYFVLSLVLFADREEGEKCDKAIYDLKERLGHRSDFEFHFNHNTDQTKEAFLEVIKDYDFKYVASIIDKKSLDFEGDIFEHKSSFFKYACNMAFVLITPYIKEAVVTIDRAGSKEFRTEIRKSLLANNGIDYKLVKSIKQQDSSKTNLLQVADYVAGILNRCLKNGRNCELYYEYIKGHEIRTDKFPK